MDISGGRLAGEVLPQDLINYKHKVDDAIATYVRTKSDRRKSRTEDIEEDEEKLR